MGNGQIFLFCFLAGVLAGTIVGNTGLSAQVMSRFRFIPVTPASGSMERFAAVCRKRVVQGAVGWLFGLTVCAAPCFWLLAGYLGFSVSWIITCYTAAFGVLGLPGFLLSCLPQGFFYLPGWFLLTWWGLKGQAKLRILPALLLLALFCLGAGAETFLNPFFLRLFL